MDSFVNLGLSHSRGRRKKMQQLKRKKIFESGSRKTVYRVSDLIRRARVSRMSLNFI